MGNDAFAPNQRIVALQALEQDADYSLSNEMLQRAEKALGHTMSVVAVDGMLDWLAERGLVKVSDGAIRIARLTRHGLDVARGSARVTGVDRPPPE